MKTRVGLLIENDVYFSTELCRGAKEACKELGIELVVFFGGALGYNQFIRNSQSDYQKTAVFEYANVVKLDFLIVSTSGICQSNNKIKKAFIDYFKVPTISLNSYIEGHSYTNYDSRVSVEAAVDYMIKHGKKRVGMLSGFKGNYGSQQRVSGYSQALIKNGLPIVEKRITFAPDYSRYNSDFVSKYLDENPDLDAIMCATDNLAFCLYEELKKRKVQIGEDIFVCGFDDTSEASGIVPQLASCHADASYMGYVSVIEGFKQLKTGKPFKKIIPTHFIPRMSVGYDIYNDRDLFEFIRYTKNIGEPNEYIAAGIANYVFENKLVYSSDVKKRVTSFFKIMLNLAGVETFTSEDSVIVSNELAKIFTFENTHYIDLDKILNCISVLLDVHLSNDGSHEDGIRGFYRFVYTQIINCYNGILVQREQEFLENQTIVNSINKDTMQVELRGSSYELLARNLQILGVKNAKLYIIPQEVIYYNDYTFRASKEMILKVHIKNNQIMDTNNYLCQTNDILEGISDEAKMMASVYSNQYQLGVIVMDLNYEKFATLNYLATQFGISMRMMNLVNQLDKTSVTDELTGLYNLRGLKKNVYGIIDHLSQADNAYLLLADMDNLKYINDNFGHNQGNHAIKRVRDILQRVFGHSSIISRTGGDEFVVVLRTSKAINLEEIDKRINECTQNINDTYNYPYEISLSYGIVPINQDNKQNLNDLITIADRLMYANKKKKKKARRIA